MTQGRTIDYIGHDWVHIEVLKRYIAGLPPPLAQCILYVLKRSIADTELLYILGLPDVFFKDFIRIGS